MPGFARAGTGSTCSHLRAPEPGAAPPPCPPNAPGDAPRGRGPRSGKATPSGDSLPPGLLLLGPGRKRKAPRNCRGLRGGRSPRSSWAAGAAAFPAPRPEAQNHSSQRAPRRPGAGRPTRAPPAGSSSSLSRDPAAGAREAGNVLGVGEGRAALPGPERVGASGGHRHPSPPPSPQGRAGCACAFKPGRTPGAPRLRRRVVTSLPVGASGDYWGAPTPVPRPNGSARLRPAAGPAAAARALP